MKKKIDSPKKALIIGVSDYKNLQSLRFCNNDSKEMSSLLHSLGYQVIDKIEVRKSFNVLISF